MSQDRREQIVQAAREVVAEGGLEAVSVRTVARRAGIGASTLRHYFPTQRDLYEEVLRPALEHVVSDLHVEDRQLPPRARLHECLVQFIPRDYRDADTLSLWLASYAAAVGPNASESESRTLESLAALSRERVDAWLAVLDEEGVLLLERGDALRLVLSVLDGICLQLLTPGAVVLPEHVEPTIAHVVAAIVRE
ncbi:TetR/AcrR family transcriptional regulator [uncultured Serinicoccus sp.]|uniref:TetR/AcrR family transcriptional regulator n=1 Tax=uncultured Serinicoccus sp. TaxID=735514 RepID=UPI0026177571|nr:TetR/AcrR family transcriptional regulator [uncultured Serinicoccus sp.]